AISDWLTRRGTQVTARHDLRVTVDENLAGWFASTDRRWPYSFENICAALGLDARGIRRRLGVARYRKPVRGFPLRLSAEVCARTPNISGSRPTSGTSW